MHLYEGRCFERCPAGTYASEITMERSSRRRNLTYFSESAVAKRQDSKPTATEVVDMETSGTAKTPLHCLLCHYTCATCAGPQSYQCQSCLEDAQLLNLTDREPKVFCVSDTLPTSSIEPNWHYRVDIAVSIILFSVTSITLYFIISFVLKKICRGNHYHSNIASNVAYNKLMEDDRHQSALEVEEEICKALKDYSESESEDDLRL